MTRSLMVVLAAVCIIQGVKAACDPTTVGKIMDLRKGVDDKDLLAELQGTFIFEFLYFGESTSQYAKECLTATFSGDQLEYSGAATGKFKVKYVNGIVKVFDEMLDVVFHTYIVYLEDSKVSLYTCMPEGKGTNFFFSGVAVKSSALSSKTDLEEAKAALAKIGVNELVSVAPCA